MSLKAGLGLLEIIIAISIMAILAAIAIPNLRSRLPSQLTAKFISNLNAISQVAWQDAIITGRLHRIVFDFAEKKVYIEKEKEEAVGKHLDESTAFEPLSSAYVSGSIKYPAHLEIREFYVDGKDQRATGKAWYFIAPNGIAQEVIINIEDVSKEDIAEPNIFGLVLNPFSAQFKEHETYQEPT